MLEVNKICPLCYNKFKPKYHKQKFCCKGHYLIYASLHPNRGCYKKGHVSWNKRMKGTHFSPETEFKKGRERKDLAPIYSLRRRKHKREKFCRNYIKISQPGKWILYARFLWIKRYGKIIKGDVIRHINGMSHDDREENLVAMPRKYNHLYNTVGSNRLLIKDKIKYFISRYNK